MRSIRTSIIAALVAAWLASTHPGANAQENKPPPANELKLSTAVGTAFALGKAGERWGAMIAERSAGSIEVKHHPGATLSVRDPFREFLALRDGGADLAIGSSLTWSSNVKELTVIGLPWLAPEASQLDALVTGTVKESLSRALLDTGVVPLAFAPLGHREIAAVARAVRTPDDVAGLKLRIVATPFLVDLYAGLRAGPQAMAFADAQAAFKAGTLDAQEGPAATLAATRVDALGVRHLTLWGAVAEIAIFAVNRGVWDSWPEDVRALVRAAALDSARELASLARAETDAAVAELRKRGMSVTRLTPAGRAAFAAASRPVYDRWAGVAGEALVRAAEAAVKAATSSPGERTPGPDCGSAGCSSGTRTAP